MYLEMVIRIFSDCCLLFALLGCCPTVLPYSFPLPAAALICGVSVAISVFLFDKRKKKLSYLCALLPFLSLLLAPRWQEMAVLVIPILYACSVIFRSGVNMEYYKYSAFFKRSLAILFAAWAIISAVIYFEDPKGLVEPIIITDTILQYTLIYFLCGVILQRQLRLGARSRGGAGQIFGMLGCVGAVCFGFVLTEPLLRNGSVNILRNLSVILITPFMYVLKLYAFIQEKLRRMKTPEQIKQELENSPPSESGGLTPYQQRMQELEAMGPKAGHSGWVMLIAILVVLILVILMVIAFTKFRRRRGGYLISAEAKGDAGKKRLPRMSNRNRVRQSYRDFLRFERGQGLKIKKQYTTADILSRISQDTDKNAASELRDIYLRARYDDKTEVKNTEVHAAKSALKRIRKF